MTSWFWLAVLAAAFWGLTYVLNQFMLRSLNAYVVFFLSAAFITVVLGAYLTFTHQWQGVINTYFGNYKLMGATLAYVICYLVAGLLILLSIGKGNASLAALIESAYPLFTIPLAYLILREVQFNWGVLIGAALILSGLAVVQYTNPG